MHLVCPCSSTHSSACVCLILLFTMSPPASSIRVSSYSSCAFLCAVAETQGLRDEYEDAHAVGFHDLATDLWILDGHHGDAAAKLGAPALAKELGPSIKGDKLPSHDRINQSFRAVDNQLRQTFKASPDDAKAGSTVVGVLAAKQSNGSYNAQLINCGDSRGVFISPGIQDESKEGKHRKKKPSVIVESIDHKPNHPEEKKRIEAAGGRVKADGKTGPYRIDGNLSVSRGLGDFKFKSDRKRSPNEQKVSCSPDIYELTDLKPGTLVVLACDGLWDVMSSKDVAARLRSRMEDKGVTSLADLARDLVQASLKKKSKDNVTVLLAKLGEPEAKTNLCNTDLCSTSEGESGSASEEEDMSMAT